MDEVQLSALIDRAALVAVNVYREEQQKKDKRNEARIRRNTAKLLRNYDRLNAFVTNSISDSTQLEDSWLAELLGEMFNEDGIVVVKSILKRKEQTELMMAHINNVLKMYKAHCEAESKEKGLPNYYHVATRYYMNGDSWELLANDLHVDVRTVKRYIQRGNDDISALLWGVIGLV